MAKQKQKKLQKDSKHSALDLDGDGVVSDGRIKALSDLFGLFYIGQAGVIGSYMGMTAYMAKGK